MHTPDIAIVPLAPGWGESPKTSQTVLVHYSGWLTDGTPFDSSIDRGEPLAFVLGVGAVIKGWDLVLSQMKVGERLKATIPSALAYGEAGYPGVIPPNASLVFDMHLVAIQ